jgi:hypothetical protein
MFGVEAGQGSGDLCEYVEGDGRHHLRCLRVYLQVVLFVVVAVRLECL